MLPLLRHGRASEHGSNFLDCFSFGFFDKEQTEEEIDATDGGEKPVHATVAHQILEARSKDL